MSSTVARLTSFSHGAGCACKLGPADLAQVLSAVALEGHPNLLVGLDTRDDAAVYQLTPDLAVVLTADFITPIVDDASDFGAIAAANALSDIYAMGGDPLLGINLTGFPRDSLPLSTLAETMSAAAAVMHDAGAVIAGGHTIDDPEFKFGLAVVGKVHPTAVIRNSAGQDGDLLYLTKPLGVGIATTAMKRGVQIHELEAMAINQMRETNRAAARAVRNTGIVAATDVTGFGLLGHLGEMAAGSGLAATLDGDRIPLLPRVLELAQEGIVSGGTKRNLEAASAFTDFEGLRDDEFRLVLADAQTSGGLLVAVTPDLADELESAFVAEDVRALNIGELHTGTVGHIQVK